MATTNSTTWCRRAVDLRPVCVDQCVRRCRCIATLSAMKDAETPGVQPLLEMLRRAAKAREGSASASLSRAEAQMLADELARLLQSNQRLRSQNSRLRKRVDRLKAGEPDLEGGDEE